MTKSVLARRTRPVFRSTVNRCFSSQTDVALSQAEQDQDTIHNDVQKSTMSSMEASKYTESLKAQYAEDNKDYLSMLSDTEARQAYFSQLAQPNAADHSEIR